LGVLKEPSLDGNDAKSRVDLLEGTSITSVGLAVEIERRNRFVSLVGLYSAEGMLKNQASKLSHESFQASLELVVTGGSDFP